ncbi:LysM domain-containing protein [Tumebacillus sp. BK434]|uniref:LysM peptidoglycan-binding domain-containing protein n=1 Tax=Tumebacillus sp. BK434 TaxID=2512169 RepID=UPI001051EF98|nr:LysM peptidoglycan-binding domain-containing protein [Tumebacillus sp. BK434]TCP57979.1 LysM domain-containing protein [Tumebacillus sp. BK434]
MSYGTGQIGPFLLTYWDQVGVSRTLAFPVAPAQISVKYAHEFQESSVLGLGQTAFRGGDQLAELSFSSFFPRDYDRTLVDTWAYSSPESLKSPQEFERIIHEIRQVGKPSRLTIGGTYFNADVMIRTFDVEHRGGEPGDVYFTITFKKHRTLTVKKTDPKQGTSSGSERPPSAPAPKTHTVVSGDTLWALAKRYLGNGAKYMEIYNLNTGVIGKDPNLIRPGQVLKLPPSAATGAPSVAGAK